MSRRPRLLHSLLCLLAGAALAWSWSTLAANTDLDTDPRVFPYNGTLELNGSSYTGTLQLKFSVTDDASCTFTETQTVAVYAGRFNVNIGSTSATGVPSCLFDAQRVYISMSVKGPADSGFTALSGRQRVRPVPYALWSAQGSDFKVDGAITATGNISTTGGGVTATGALTGGSLSTTGAASIGGSLTAGGTTGTTLEFKGYDFKLGTNDGRTTAATNRYAMSHYANDRLAFNYGSGFTGGLEFNGPNYLYGGTYVGNGRPASGVPQLRLADNFDDTLDNLNDYQILLHTGGGTGQTAYGLGIQSYTVFYNSQRYHKFMVDGTTRLLLDGQGKAAFATGVDVVGDVTVTGNMTVSGSFMRYSDPYSVQFNNNSGGNSVNMGSTTNRFCFLTKVALEDIDSDGEVGTCSVEWDVSGWRLWARLGAPNGSTTRDADAYCEARCISWN